jgi:hypothetical protein
MKNARMRIWLVAVALFFCFGLPKAMGNTIVIANGGINNFTGLNQNDIVVKNSPSGGITTVNLLPGGLLMGELDAYDGSQINVSGGSITYGCGLYAYNSSRITISSGSVGNFSAYDNSQLTMSGGAVTYYDLWGYGNSGIVISGGSIAGRLIANNNSQITISGGTIGTGIYAGWQAFSKSTITFVGHDFAINGTNAGYGEYTLRDMSIGTLSGTLANGGFLNNKFYITEDSRIILAPVPEPATLLLLGLGAVILRKPKK